MMTLLNSQTQHTSSQMQGVYRSGFSDNIVLTHSEAYVSYSERNRRES